MAPKARGRNARVLDAQSNQEPTEWNLVNVDADSSNQGPDVLPPRHQAGGKLSTGSIDSSTTAGMAHAHPTTGEVTVGDLVKKIAGGPAPNAHTLNHVALPTNLHPNMGSDGRMADQTAYVPVEMLKMDPGLASRPASIVNDRVYDMVYDRANLRWVKVSPRVEYGLPHDERPGEVSRVARDGAGGLGTTAGVGNMGNVNVEKIGMLAEIAAGGATAADSSTLAATVGSSSSADVKVDALAKLPYAGKKRGRKPKNGGTPKQKKEPKTPQRATPKSARKPRQKDSDLELELDLEVDLELELELELEKSPARRRRPRRAGRIPQRTVTTRPRRVIKKPLPPQVSDNDDLSVAARTRRKVYVPELLYNQPILQQKRKKKKTVDTPNELMNGAADLEMARGSEEPEVKQTPLKKAAKKAEQEPETPEVAMPASELEKPALLQADDLAVSAERTQAVPPMTPELAMYAPMQDPAMMQQAAFGIPQGPILSSQSVPHVYPQPSIGPVEMDSHPSNLLLARKSKKKKAPGVKKRAYTRRIPLTQKHIPVQPDVLGDPLAGKHQVKRTPQKASRRNQKGIPTSSLELDNLGYAAPILVGSKPLAVYSARSYPSRIPITRLLADPLPFSTFYFNEQPAGYQGPPINIAPIGGSVHNGAAGGTAIYGMSPNDLAVLAMSNVESSTNGPAPDKLQLVTPKTADSASKTPVDDKMPTTATSKALLAGSMPVRALTSTNYPGNFPSNTTTVPDRPYDSRLADQFYGGGMHMEVPSSVTFASGHPILMSSVKPVNMEAVTFRNTQNMREMPYNGASYVQQPIRNQYVQTATGNAGFNSTTPAIVRSSDWASRQQVGNQNLVRAPSMQAHNVYATISKPAQDKGNEMSASQSMPDKSTRDVPISPSSIDKPLAQTVSTSHGQRLGTHNAAEDPQSPTHISSAGKIIRRRKFKKYERSKRKLVINPSSESEEGYSSLPDESTSEKVEVVPNGSVDYDNFKNLMINELLRDEELLKARDSIEVRDSVASSYAHNASASTPRVDEGPGSQKVESIGENAAQTKSADGAPDQVVDMSKDETAKTNGKAEVQGANKPAHIETTGEVEVQRPGDAGAKAQSIDRPGENGNDQVQHAYRHSLEYQQSRPYQQVQGYPPPSYQQAHGYQQPQAYQQSRAYHQPQAHYQVQAYQHAQAYQAGQGFQQPQGYQQPRVILQPRDIQQVQEIEHGFKGETPNKRRRINHLGSRHGDDSERGVRVSSDDDEIDISRNSVGDTRTVRRYQLYTPQVYSQPQSYIQTPRALVERGSLVHSHQSPFVRSQQSPIVSERTPHGCRHTQMYIQQSQPGYPPSSAYQQTPLSHQQQAYQHTPLVHQQQVYQQTPLVHHPQAYKQSAQYPRYPNEDANPRNLEYGLSREPSNVVQQTHVDLPNYSRNPQLQESLVLIRVPLSSLQGSGFMDFSNYMPTGNDRMFQIKQDMVPSMVATLTQRSLEYPVSPQQTNSSGVYAMVPNKSAMRPSFDGYQVASQNNMAGMINASPRVSHGTQTLWPVEGHVGKQRVRLIPLPERRLSQSSLSSLFDQIQERYRRAGREYVEFRDSDSE